MKNYLKLIRPYGMLFLGFTPVFSAIANNELSFSHLTLLFIIGIFTHIFGFVQNDYYDFEIDSKSKYVSSRPISAGYISKKTAFVIFTLSFLISLIIAVLFLFSFVSFLFLLFSFFCMGVYNKYSKRLFGMEYILSIGVFTLGLFGALTVSNNISFLAIIVSALGLMQWLFSVGISANLKDIEFDSKLGIRTTPIIFGVYVLDEKLVIPTYFALYAFIIKFIHIFIASLPFFLGYTSIFFYDLPLPGVCFIIISIILFYLIFKILSTPLNKRDKMLIYIGLQEGFALLLSPIAIMSFLIERISLLSTFLLILILIFWPIFWFIFLFGKRMIPLE